MRIQCYVCLRNATHEYEGRDYCDNCAPYEEDDIPADNCNEDEHER